MHAPLDKEFAGSGLEFLAGEGEMRRRIRDFDWTKTELGHPAGWPKGLRTALEIMLNCGAPAYIAWGPRFIQFYNDDYISILGERKHPQALGATTSATWSEIWDFVECAFSGVLASRRPLAMANELLPMWRNGYLEECYFSFSYSALLDDDGRASGILAVTWETTAEFVSYRRANTLRMLAQGLSEAREMAGIRSAFEKTVLANPEDLPFGLWYEVRPSRSGLDLVAAAGVERGSALCPELIDSQQGSLYGGLMSIATPVVQSLPFPPEMLRWERPERPLATPEVLMCKPLCYSNYQHPDSYVVLAVNPMRPNDASQQDFLQMIRMHLEHAVRRVSRVEVERREYEHQFHSIMSAIPFLVWLSDPDGRCTFVNQAWEGLTGMTPDQAMGTGWTEAFHPDDRGAIPGMITSRRQDALNLEYRLRDSRGQYRWMLDKVTPRYGLHGEFLGYTGTAIDITERKEAEQRMLASQTELRTLYDQLQTARDEERCALAREVHDQLGQILSATKIDIKLLEERVRSDHACLSQEDIVTELYSASLNLEKAIGVVRRLATELRPPELESQGLATAIHWHALDFERRTRIRCNVALGACTPQISEAGAVALFRIFQESLTNILRHAKATEVWISLELRAGRALLRVRDNGVGIRKECARSARSVGLKGMRERALLAGGRLVVGALQPCGTLVAARIPLVQGGIASGFATPAILQTMDIITEARKLVPGAARKPSRKATKQ